MKCCSWIFKRNPNFADKIKTCPTVPIISLHSFYMLQSLLFTMKWKPCSFLNHFYCIKAISIAFSLSFPVEISNLGGFQISYENKRSNVIANDTREEKHLKWGEHVMDNTGHFKLKSKMKLWTEIVGFLMTSTDNSELQQKVPEKPPSWLSAWPWHYKHCSSMSTVESLISLCPKC